MKIKLLAGAALAALFAVGGVAHAEPDGWYGAVDLGYHWPDTFKVTSSTLGSQSIKLENTWTGFARLGYRFNPHWRLELEGGYRPGKIKTVGHDGEVKDWTVMGNVLYDFGSPDSHIRPFLGAGIGVGRVSMDDFSPPQYLTDDNHTSFAWQGIAGLAFRMGERTNLDLTYRYYDQESIRLTSGGTAGLLTGKYRDQSLTLGLRHAFAAPPPPPPPPPPEAKEFIVYFPFDQYILTPEAQNVVTAAASYANQGNHATRVVVVGHTDTSGSAAYNVRLSERRAKAVADALVGQGVASGTLQVDWKGETDLAVPTPDGTKEPLNRRATIDINF